MKNFDDSFTALIGNEGGFSDNPKDPGNWTGGTIGVGTLDGTMWGVSAKVARENGYTGKMKDLPISFAKSLAKSRYWDPYKLDEIDPDIAFQIFDSAYNGGHPAQWLQQAAGVQVDGVIGPATIAAVNATDQYKMIMRIDAYRLIYMTQCKNWPDASRGWATRIANNLLKGANNAD
jgi:lysozyme family protein